MISNSLKPIDNHELQPVSNVTFKDYIALLKRRKNIILQTFIIVSIVGIGATLLMKPVYESSAKIVVDPPLNTMNSVDTSNPLSSILMPPQPQEVDTQVQVLQAQPLMSQVWSKYNKPDLTVAQIDKTNVIEITSQAHNPFVAADAANYLVSLYMAEQTDQNVGELRTARLFAEKQGALARARLNAADAALARYKRNGNIADLNHEKDSRISMIDAMQMDYDRIKADLDATRFALARDKDSYKQQPDSIETPLRMTNTEVATLQDSLYKLQAERQSMVQPGGFTAKSPQVKAIDAQISELKNRINTMPHVVTNVLSNPNPTKSSLAGRITEETSQVASLSGKLQTLTSSLARTKASVGSFPDQEAMLTKLTREQEEAAAEDKMFTQKLVDLSLREKAQHAVARVIEPATPPAVPIRPKRMLNFILACLLGLVVGIGLAVLQDFMDDRVYSVGDAERILGLPSLGQVQALNAGDARLVRQMKFFDPYLESYRVLRTNIHFASIDSPMNTILVTSPNPGEGKTTTAANIAFAMAMDNKQVILVDTHLRHPSLHKVLEIPPVPGLTDVLLGRSTLSEALLQDHTMPNLSILTCGSLPPNPSELLGSRTFRTLMDQLTERADVVIFDSAPVLAGADTRILASIMDGVVIVLDIGESKQAQAREAVALLRQARANILGMIHNKVALPEGYTYYLEGQFTSQIEEPMNGQHALPNHSNYNHLVVDQDEDEIEEADHAASIK